MSVVVGQFANLSGQIINLPHDIDFLSPNSRRACTPRVHGEQVRRNIIVRHGRPSVRPQGGRRSLSEHSYAR